ncbi:hypothetical protein J1N09_00750 [Aureitalea sp. L0-47]|uniref:hypothetical protein n=1 Tax=Aureitalea sp. L0-47 TaxID=2816962 RepID=UPI0022383C14|nr:hypothetical protein [Aureitalea sp. L0-47]MCW5518346.1 hypothetical protein [Aureitalea sp. L0-47]
MTLFRTLFVLLSITIVSCNSGSKATNGDGPDKEELAMIAKKMKEAGFYSGTVMYSDAEGDCPYTIDVDSDDYTYLLDPINMDEKYQKDGAKIWFKFAGLKMMNRCEKANPISIVEIQDRM